MIFSKKVVIWGFPLLFFETWRNLQGYHVGIGSGVYPREDIKTKTIKTLEEAASACISENSSELDSSATQSSAAIDNGNSTSSGKKQKSFDRLRNRKFDWKQRHPWMICPPNEKEGKCLLNEIISRRSHLRTILPHLSLGVEEV